MSDPGFRITGSTTLGEHGFLTFDELDVRAPAGSRVKRVVVRHPGAVAVLPFTDHGVALIRQYRAAVDEQLLEIPAGKLDIAGEPPAVTAHRELEEEMGYRAGRMEEIASFFTTPGFSDEIMYLFAAYDLEPVPSSPVGPEEEAAEIVDLELSEIEAALGRGEIRDAKTLVALWWAVAAER